MGTQESGFWGGTEGSESRRGTGFCLSYSHTPTAAVPPKSIYNLLVSMEGRITLVGGVRSGP